MHNSVKIIIGLFLLCWIPSYALTAEVTYYHTDAYGTPLAMTDSTGKVVWKGDYYPFGEEYLIEETPEKNKRHFTGKEKDEESGLHYFGARFMDEKSGRFVSPDPVTAVDPESSATNTALLGNPLRLNRYVYGLNNPYRYIDPDGNWAEAIFIEGPSIAVGTQSLISNIKQGNYRSAAVDAMGIAADTAAAVAPGLPGGVGLGIKAQRTSKTLASEARLKNLTRGIPANQLGPSGKPKIHVTKHTSMKNAKDAARARAGKDGSTIKHTSPQEGGAHFHGLRKSGNKIRTHDEYPR